MRHRPIPFGATLVLLFVLAASSGIGAAPGRRPQGPPAKSAAPARVDFRAIGESGAPILDLEPAELSLKIDGRTREVRSLELIRPGGGTAAALPAPFASNRPGDSGRSVVLMLEDESILQGSERPVKEAVGALLDNLSGQDVVSLLVIARGRFDPGPTTQHATVRAAMAAFVGAAKQSESANDAACRTQRAISAAQSVMTSLASGPPTTVIFVSGGLTRPVASDIIVSKATDRGVAIDGSAACEIRRNLFDRVGAVAKRTSGELYVAYLPPDAQGGAQSASGAEAETGVELLASVAGTPLIRLTGDVRAAMTKVARETSAYYVASFEPDASDRPGSTASVELRVSRNNARIRARSDMTFAKDAGAPSGQKALSARDLLRVATSSSDLPIRAVACPARDAGDKDLKVVVMVEPFETGVPLASAAVGLYDEKGKLVVQWTAQANDLQARPVLAGFTARPGTYRMRVAATDGSGRAGTVDQHLTLALEKGAGPIQMSALVFGVARGQAFSPQLLFGRETGALGSFEVYGAPPAAVVTAAVEIAASPSGPVIATAPARVGGPVGDGRRVALAAIPLGPLPPGDYLVRVVVSVDGQPAGSVTRTLRKTGS